MLDKVIFSEILLFCVCNILFCLSDDNTKILATGGASVNKPILQVIADVFNSPVYLQVTTVCTNSLPLLLLLCFQDMADSAVLGAAYQAKHAYVGNSSDYNQLTKSLKPPHLVCEPYKDAAEIYEPMVIRYRSIVKSLVNENK